MIKITKFQAVLFVLTALGLFGFAVACVIDVRSPKNVTDEYPDAPFQPIPADAPRIFTETENPEKYDKQAAKAFSEANQKRIAYIKNQGSEKDVSPEERKALDAYWSNNSIRGRMLSEAILKDNPRSIPAMFVRGAALINAGSNPAAALNQVRTLRHYLEMLGRQNPADAHAREWYLRNLEMEVAVLMTLGCDVEGLRCIELMEQIYSPQPWRKVWMQFRLNRLDEAERSIVETEKNGNWKVTALNDRGTLELNRIQRAAAYETYKKLVTLAPETETYMGNLGEAAFKNFQFAEAEKAYLKSTKLAKTNSTSSRYTDLAQIYLQQGRIGEAIDALKKLQAQRARRHPYTWQYDQAAIDATLASLLIHVGKIADAERIVRRAYDNPDRYGFSDANESDKTLSVSLSLWSILQCRIAELQEAEVTESTFGAAYRERQSLDLEAWRLEKKITKLLDNERLTRFTFTPMFGSCPLELLRILPRGVALSAIEFASQSDEHPAAAAYFNGYRAEVAFHHGQWNEAIRLAQVALEKLPADGEKLFCSRLQAIAGLAELKLGETAKSLVKLDPVLDSNPALLRLLGARIPVKIDSDDSPAASQLAALLAKSPRLLPSSEGFRISIRSKGNQLTVEMFRLNNVRHTEQKVEIADNDLRAAVIQVYKQLHSQMATPAVSLDQPTINSLESIPIAIAERNQVARHVEFLHNPKFRSKAK